MGTGLRILIALWLGLFSAEAGAQDYGIPDTARTLSPSITISDCVPTIKIKVPVYLFSDGDGYSPALFRFNWTGDAICDTIVAKGVWATHSSYVEQIIDNGLKTAQFVVTAFPLGYPVTNGIVAEIEMSSGLADSIAIQFPINEFMLYSLFGNWQPTFQYLNRGFETQDTLVLMEGDADCSGQVSIADVVFLINYIFSGGMPPYDRNAADPDESCAISIADAVYIINYIFAGGNDPQPGCVVP